MECFSKRQLVARACILIKKILQFWDRDFIKKLSNDNYVYIVYQRVFIPLGSNQSANVCNPGCNYDSSPPTTTLIPPGMSGGRFKGLDEFSKLKPPSGSRR